MREEIEKKVFEFFVSGKQLDINKYTKSPDGITIGAIIMRLNYLQESYKIWIDKNPDAKFDTDEHLHRLFVRACNIWPVFLLEDE